MNDHMEAIADRMAASEHENSVLRANNAKLTADMESLHKEMAAMRALMAEINSVLGLNEAEPADARTTLDALRAIVESCDATSAKLERSRDNWEDRAVELVRALNGNLGRFMDPPTRREILAMFPPSADMSHSGRASLHSVRGLAEFFDSKAMWSRQTFGPGDRYKGVIKHIRKELEEIEEKPDDLEEWVDVVLLAMDGAWRSAGADGLDFVQMMTYKDQKNRQRSWPDWRTLERDAVSEHIKQAVDDGAVAIPTVDLEVQRYRAPWQGVNENGAAVRLTHIPTGHAVSVAMYRKHSDNLVHAKLKMAEELARRPDLHPTCANCDDSGIVNGPGEYTTSHCPECNPHSVVDTDRGKLIVQLRGARKDAESWKRLAQDNNKQLTICKAERDAARADAAAERADHQQTTTWLNGARTELARLTTLRPRAEWQESDGMVLWHANSDDVLPMIGWREDTPTLYYNWTPLPKVQP